MLENGIFAPIYIYSQDKRNQEANLVYAVIGGFKTSTSGSKFGALSLGHSLRRYICRSMGIDLCQRPLYSVFIGNMNPEEAWIVS